LSEEWKKNSKVYDCKSDIKTFFLSVVRASGLKVNNKNNNKSKKITTITTQSTTTAAAEKKEANFLMKNRLFSLLTCFSHTAKIELFLLSKVEHENISIVSFVPQIR
jgi:hypothetical protein